MRRRYVVVLFFVGTLVGILLLPFHHRCPVYQQTCAAPPVNPDIYSVQYYYQIEPLGIALLETVLNRELGLIYSDGHEDVPHKDLSPNPP